MSCNYVLQYIAEGLHVFSEWSIVAEVAFCVIIILLEVRYDSREMFILKEVGYSKKQIIMYEGLKCAIQFTIAFIVSFLFCAAILKLISNYSDATV